VLEAANGGEAPGGANSDKGGERLENFFRDGGVTVDRTKTSFGPYSLASMKSASLGATGAPCSSSDNVTILTMGIQALARESPWLTSAWFVSSQYHAMRSGQFATGIYCFESFHK